MKFQRTYTDYLLRGEKTIPVYCYDVSEIDYDEEMPTPNQCHSIAAEILWKRHNGTMLIDCVADAYSFSHYNIIAATAFCYSEETHEPFELRLYFSL